MKQYVNAEVRMLYISDSQTPHQNDREGFLEQSAGLHLHSIRFIPKSSSHWCFLILPLTQQALCISGYLYLVFFYMECSFTIFYFLWFSLDFFNLTWLFVINFNPYCVFLVLNCSKLDCTLLIHVLFIPLAFNFFLYSIYDNYKFYYIFTCFTFSLSAPPSLHQI